MQMSVGKSAHTAREKMRVSERPSIGVRIRKTYVGPVIHIGCLAWRTAENAGLPGVQVADDERR